ncbi:hypothetical protein [Bradyrhizobium yuanmingense]|uniref:hypothetical protein n=1 Tax=Bradyrhizobium yuanmingense TaxID=108015 RepID=UPI0023B9E988|nr:hypothetical protein [Bradyrhizobium yuanmingense]MDF0498247.1 hypothetical protein [Bradyrhizobium yuanmingense]
MDDRLTSILRRYSHGEISAERAADEMGATYNVADVYVLSREARLPLPDPDGPFERAQFERAKRLFAGVPGSSQRSEKHA